MAPFQKCLFFYKTLPILPPISILILLLYEMAYNCEKQLLSHQIFRDLMQQNCSAKIKKFVSMIQARMYVSVSGYHLRLVASVVFLMTDNITIVP